MKGTREERKEPGRREEKGCLLGRGLPVIAVIVIQAASCCYWHCAAICGTLLCLVTLCCSLWLCVMSCGILLLSVTLWFGL